MSCRSGDRPARSTTNSPSTSPRSGRRCELIVVDGSDPVSFDAAHAAWSGLGHHVRPDDAIAGRNGKVRGVLTGVALASHERVVIADDDVRYDARRARTDHRGVERRGTGAAAELLRSAGVARALGHRADAPQSGRARRRLPRHARGAAQRAAPDRRVRRRRPLREPRAHPDDRGRRWARAQPSRPLRPAICLRRPATSGRSDAARPTTSSRARGVSARTLAIVPLVAWALARRRHRRRVGLAAVSVVVLAEAGRRRAGGTAVFPRSASLFAPLWLVERSVCSWLALASRLRGGCPYGGTRLRVAATSRRTLRRRLQAHDDDARTRVPERGWEADDG